MVTAFYKNRSGQSGHIKLNEAENDFTQKNRTD